jgi:VanZ family protein
MPETDPQSPAVASSTDFRLVPLLADRRSRPGAARRSPLTRAALLVYVVLLIYGSLSPWQHWRSLGVSPFAFLQAPWPAYVTGFDLALNVLAYAPLGALAVLALHPDLRGLPAPAAAIAGSAALSLALEALQTYLPARIPSNLDLATNVAGAALGSVLGAVFAPALIERGRLRQARRRWFRPDATILLLLVALWPLAQVHPGSTLFGNGELDRDLIAAVLGLFGITPRDFDAGQFAAAEVLITAAGLLGAGGAFAASMKRGAPRLRLLLFLLAAAVLSKAITYAHQFGPQRVLAWLTPGAISGLAVGLLAITAVANAPTRIAGAVAVAALAVLLVTVNLLPVNPYHVHWLATWQPGKLRDVAAASDWLAQALPYALLAALLWLLLRRRSRLRARRGY